MQEKATSQNTSTFTMINKVEHVRQQQAYSAQSQIFNQHLHSAGQDELLATTNYSIQNGHY